MKRINVIGTTGSGKTTFSRHLAEALNIPCVQMDELFWKPNWVESTDEEFLPKIEAAVNEEAWVLDGNYSRTVNIKWQRADTVIWLDYSYLSNFKQLFGRTLKRAFSKQELWPNTGNRESLKKSFFDRSSILLLFIKAYGKNRKRYLAVMKSNDYPHVNFVRITNRKQAQAFIEQARHSR